MLTPERKAEIRKLVRQLSEGERTRAAVAVVIGWEIATQPVIAGITVRWRSLAGKGWEYSAPEYTTSLDAFMQDVEPWMVENNLHLNYYGRNEDGDGHEVLITNHGFGPNDKGEAFHAIPAAACCHALLIVVGLDGIIEGVQP